MRCYTRAHLHRYLCSTNRDLVVKILKPPTPVTRTWVFPPSFYFLLDKRRRMDHGYKHWPPYWTAGTGNLPDTDRVQQKQPTLGLPLQVKFMGAPILMSHLKDTIYKVIHKDTIFCEGEYTVHSLYTGMEWIKTLLCAILYRRMSY